MVDGAPLSHRLIELLGGGVPVVLVSAAQASRLRPGMEGIGKVTIDRRKLIWVWTHKMIDWMRLQLWRWMP